MKNSIIIISLFCLIQFLDAQVYTDFESDSLDGWRSEGDGSYNLENETGNPGSCMRVDDDATGDTNIATAPVTYLGNWSAADSTDSLMVDVFVSLLNGSLMPNLWVFRISGPGGSATGPLVTLPVGQWNHAAFALDSSQWNLTSGTWKKLLEYVSHLELRAEFINGDEFVRLDNIGLTFSPVVVPVTPPVYSNFEQGIYEGWTFESSGGVSIPSTGGNPGRYVSITDAAGLTNAVAPPKFLGDWSALDESAALLFDLKITNFSGPLLFSDYWLKIKGPGGEALMPMDSSITRAFNQWATFSFLISENEFTVSTGDWQSLVSNISDLRLLIEYIDGTELISFDNFRISDSPPVADFRAEPIFAFLGDEICFTDLSLNAPDSWYWDFGDGSSSTDESPNHTYVAPGCYDVSLRADNYFGADEIIKNNYLEIVGITDSILFFDDFDDNQIHPAWKFVNGTWAEQNQTMTQTSNYYSGNYIGGCYALAGSPYWKNYQLNVDFLSTDNDKIGVVFNFQDAANFYLFTWQQEGTHRAIKRFVNGIQTDLAVDALGYVSNQWYHLAITTMNGKITASVDSVEIFSISDSTFTVGKAGLYCHGNQSSFWDNFEITNLDFISAIENESLSEIPAEYRLEQNYPNPFNPKTLIRYAVPVTSNIDLSIYNILGQKITTLISGKQPAGIYSVEFDGNSLTSGVYFYTLITDQGFSETKKLVLLR